jgi:hypothetical protein
MGSTPRWLKGRSRLVFQAAILTICAAALLACGTLEQPHSVAPASPSTQATRSPEASEIQAAPGTPTEPGTRTPSIDPTIIAGLLDPDETYPPRALTNVANKARELQSWQGELSTPGATRDARTSRPTNRPSPTQFLRRAGIQSCLREAAVMGFMPINCWSKNLEEVRLTVEAGEEHPGPANNQPTRGAVMVTVRSHQDRSQSQSEVYWAPGEVRTGALQVIYAREMHIVLQAENGTLFGFNAETRQWEPPVDPDPRTPTLTVKPMR